MPTNDVRISMSFKQAVDLVSCGSCLHDLPIFGELCLNFRQEKAFYEWLHTLPSHCRLVLVEVTCQ